MTRPKSPVSTTAHLVRVLWQAPLMALPFALFFKVVMNSPWSWFGRMFQIALVFTYVISLAIWLLGWWERRSGAKGMLDSGAGRRGVVLIIARRMGVSLLATVLAAAIIDRLLLPGFLGSAQSLSVVLVYGTLFASLFMGVAFALSFYRHAIDRVRSEEELHLARRIQRSFLISNFPQRPGIEIHALNVSSKEVSGDFYDVVPVRDDGSRLLLEAGGMVVGVSEQIPYEHAVVQLAPGDRVMFYTDGMSEAMNDRMEMYGDEQVVDFAAALPATLSPRQQIDAILAGLRTFLAGVEAQDDITLMMLRVRQPRSGGAS